MKTIYGSMLLCAVVLAWGCGCTGPRNPEAEKAAEEAAIAWLTRVDQGAYEESWEQAAGFFKAAVSKEKWMQTSESIRKPLGNSLARTLMSARYRTTMPGAPDGEYVILQFKSSFENKKSAVETVTPMLDPDGVWRISGYFIK